LYAKRTKKPSDEIRQESISFSDQIDIARKMLARADERNRFAQDMGGGDFEGFARYGQYEGNNRAKYDALCQEFELYRKRFDEVVSDRKAFVKKLRSVGENELADAFAQMFRVKESLIGKLFKR
jgi:hypothetical protein